MNPFVAVATAYNRLIATRGHCTDSQLEQDATGVVVRMLLQPLLVMSRIVSV